MGKSYDAPEAPDPKVTAAAQTGSNVSSAIANTAMAQVGQVTPDGSLRYQVTGNHTWTDPSSGAEYTVPQYTAFTELSPEAQKIRTAENASKLNLANLASSQSARAGELLSSTVDMATVPKAADRSGAVAPDLVKSYNTDFSADRQRVEDALMARLNPQLEQARQNAERQAANRGIGLESTAYRSMMDGVGRNENDARFGAILSAGQEQSRLAGLTAAEAAFRNQAAQQGFSNQQALFDAQDNSRSRTLQETYAARNQPINEITALLSGSQVATPQFGIAQSAQFNPADYAGLVQQNFSNQLELSKMKQADAQATMGAVTSLAGGAMMMSDRTLKKDVEKVGEAKGHNLYSFRYKSEPASAPKRFGVIAQEVRKTRPDAIATRADGKLAVDYGRLFADKKRA